MGTFSVTFEIGDPQGERYESIEAVVDTGSTYTWIPQEILGRLGVTRESRMEFQTADGHVVERDIAETSVRLDGRHRTTIVVFAGEDDSALLGAYTLEGLGLAVDPLGQRLVPTRGLALGHRMKGEEDNG